MPPSSERTAPLRKTTRYIIYTVLAALLAGTLYLYRTLELGRGDAQPAILEILNPAGEMVGPEGIRFDSAGNLYLGDSQGIIWQMEQGGSPHVYAQLTKVQPLPGMPAATVPIRVGGIALDARGDLYAACYGYGGGSILFVEAGTKETRFFAHDIGSAADLILSRDDRYLWVSDNRSPGRLLRYTIGGILPVQPDVIVAGLEHPKGLAFGRDESALYASETYSGNIARIDFATDKPRVEQVIDLAGSFATGSLGGLAFDPRDGERRFLYVAENIRGIFAVVDLRSRPARVMKSYRLALMGGRPCPAFMAVRDGHLYFTDLWTCSPLRILLGIPKWHNHAYRFRVLDLSSLYTMGTQIGSNQ